MTIYSANEWIGSCDDEIDEERKIAHEDYIMAMCGDGGGEAVRMQWRPAGHCYS